MTPIYFYLPKHKWPFDAVPREVREEDLEGRFLNHTTSLNWTLQTYLRLRRAGFPCDLVEEVPGNGAVVVTRSDLEFGVKPSPSQLFVCMMADGGWHPWSQVQVSQNPLEGSRTPGGVFMPHWPQPGLVPRDGVRGTAFQKAAFFGHPDQLAPELKTAEWRRFLSERGLRWQPAPEEGARGNDYSDVDLVVAVRSFDGRTYDHKPATKLHNAWRAGVPAVLGTESAYRAERTSPDDYLEVRTYSELCETIDHLQRDEGRRARLLARAVERGQEVGFEQQTERWIRLLEGTVIPAYEEWVATPRVGRALFFARRYVELRRRGLAARLRGPRRSA